MMKKRNKVVGRLTGSYLWFIILTLYGCTFMIITSGVLSSGKTDLNFSFMSKGLMGCGVVMFIQFIWITFANNILEVNKEELSTGSAKDAEEEAILYKNKWEALHEYTVHRIAEEQGYDPHQFVEDFKKSRPDLYPEENED